MAVILANASLAVGRKRHGYRRDGHGKPVAETGEDPVSEFWPGAIVEHTDNGAEIGPDYGIRLDPALWPVRQGDRVYEAQGRRVWVITQAGLKTLTGYSDVDHVAALGILEDPVIP